MSSLEQDSNAPVDPRVQIELEKLNEATDSINKYEVELDEAKNEFRELLKESVEKIKAVAKKLGNSIETAKPYYEARLYASQLTKETQQSALNYDKAKSVHAAAKEMVFLAEQGLGEKSTLDTACQEMLTHATTRVNESQNECTEMRNVLRISELKLEVANNRVAKLHSQLKGAIRASRPYYELRANYNALLLEQKQKVVDLEARVSEAKMSYNEALTRLEKISEEIHQQRKARASSIDEDASSSSSSTNHPRNQTLGIGGMHLAFTKSSSAARIESSDEYLEFPAKLAIKSSPIKPKFLDKLDCPHLLKDFARKTSPSGESDSDNNYLFSPNRTIDDITNMSSEDIEQWTEIRLSNSNSSSSGYSQHNSLALEDDGNGLAADMISDTTDTDSDDSHSGPKVKARIIKMELYDDSANQNTRKSDGITGWITSRSIGRSASISMTACSPTGPAPAIPKETSSTGSSSGRRQSLDIIIDTGDRVKDAFTQGIQRIGRSLERRNSESEVARDGDSIELEKLNEATDSINKYEVELDEAKNEFRELLKESVEKIKAVAKKLGNSIETAKPYYEARLYASQLTKETQQSALNYDKAKSVHAAAKEMVFLAEQGLGEKSTLDTACQEMLTHATTRVNESQNECTEMRNVLRISELKLEVANNRVAKLHSQLKGAIRASRPYYELRANYNALLLEQKQKVVDLEARVSEAKMSYNEALTRLEKISEEIHQQRKARASSIDEDASSSSSSTNHPRNQTLGIGGMHLAFTKSSSAARIESSDEYLEFPAKLAIKSSPIKPKFLDKLDCPHLLKDFARKTSPSGESDSDNNYLFSPNRTIDDITNMSSEDIEQWTEIRLSNSNSSSSGYSQHNSLALEDDGNGLAADMISDTTDTDSDDSHSGPKVKARIIKMELYDDSANQNTRKSDGITGWITSRSIGRSASISMTACSPTGPAPAIPKETSSTGSSSGRRQSLDIIIDTGDRVKDAFTQGIQRIGRSLERRNSESEVARDGDSVGVNGGSGSGTGTNSGTGSDFFLFQRSSDPARDGLSDEQVENLLLDQDCSDLFQNVVNLSK